MKRYAIIGCLWFLMASAMIHGNARAEIDYEIRYDSNTKQTYELKQKFRISIPSWFVVYIRNPISDGAS